MLESLASHIAQTCGSRVSKSKSWQRPSVKSSGCMMRDQKKHNSHRLPVGSLISVIDCKLMLGARCVHDFTADVHARHGARACALCCKVWVDRRR